MAASVWKGYLTFGLISVPIRLHSAARSESMHFNQLHSVCHTRIKQPQFCPTCQKQVARTEIVKGYEYEKDQYVLIEEEEIKKIAPPSARTMEIQEFVELKDVDPLYYETSYFVVPEDPGRKAYQLLVQTMEESGRAAIAKVAMHQREHVVIVRPRAHGLTLHTMYYADEVRDLPEYGSTTDVVVKPEEVKLAKQLVDSLTGSFDPERYRDEYQARLKGLVDDKLQGREVASAPEAPLAPVIDMMEALKKSLAAREASAPKKPPVRAEAAPAAAEKRSSRRAAK
ncbi:MAG TPA: Ku protein [Terriglobia bacterium]|nr:Ku protein [Terriglobia bacterium]